MTTPALDRFFQKVHQTEDCWLWVGAASTERDGRTQYGYFGEGGRSYRAHRWIYEHAVGPIPNGLTLDHLCRNTLCVNPAHLEPVTIRENLRRSDMVTGKRSAATQCPRGHPYDEANTIRSGGRRRCRSCEKAADAARRAKIPKKPRAHGPDWPGAKLSAQQVAEIQERYSQSGISYVALGALYGVTHTTIRRAVHGVPLSRLPRSRP